MKKFLAKILALTLTVSSLSVTVAAGPAKAAEKKTSQPVGKVTLQEGKTYTEYDVTNDGKADKVEIKNSNASSTDGFRVFVNGTCAMNLKKDYYYNAQCELVTLENDKKFLYVYMPSDNDYGASDLYTYKNNKFSKVVNLDKSVAYVGSLINGASIKKVSGNKITFEMNVMSYGLANMTFSVTYESRAGGMHLTSTTHKISSYYNVKSQKRGITYLTTAKSLKLYSDKTAKKASTTLKKGTSLKVTKCYVSGKTVTYYVKTKSGKTGWFVSPKVNVTEPLFTEIAFAG